VSDADFDTATVQANLCAWLTGNGFGTLDHGALDLAMQHIELHAIQPTPPEAEISLLAPEAPCLLEPCRAAGVAFALRALALYRIEAEQDLVGLVRALDSMASELSKVEGGNAFELLRFAYRQHEQLRGRGTGSTVDREFLDLACRAPAEVFVGLTGLRDRTESLATVLRTYVESHAAPKTTGGRPAQALLVALTQYLHAGGFTYSEITELLPDGVAGEGEAAEERVRKRAKSPDQRLLVTHPRAAPNGGNKPP
jgi:hypothetical protein